MRIQLKDFQTEAVIKLASSLDKMRSVYESTGVVSSVCLSAPTGSGKTVMCAAVIEALLFGNDELGILPDEQATVLWLCDSPSLNDQTRARFVSASDKLATWIGDGRHLEVVTNNFGASHDMLDPRHVYFMSKDLLGRGNLLVKGSEVNSGRVFWDIMDRTIKDPNRNLYLFIDEAHRGLGINSSRQGSTATIYANLIDGFEGRAMSPIVVGISATPKRFEDAMSQRKDRAVMSGISVSPKDVQESGLLKDTIELRVPEKDDPVDHQYLTMACERFRETIRRWNQYCDAEGERRISPLMIVQVKDKIDNAELKELCDQIFSLVPGLNPRTSIANVFGERKPLLFGSYQAPYVEPENVQDLCSIQILLAKEAISNGWDCPRAEVIFSQRRRSEPTYIAQLIGRMVRTPLARRIDSDDTLNSVACYLPQFNPETTQKVVDYLTGEGDEIGGATAVKRVIIDPVTVEEAVPRTEDDYVRELSEYEAAQKAAEHQAGYQTSLDEITGQAAIKLDETPGATEANNEAQSQPVGQTTSSLMPAEHKLEPNLFKPVPMAPPKPIVNRERSFTHEEWKGIKRAYESILVRRVPKKARNEFRSLLDTATLLMDTRLDLHAGKTVNEGFAQRLSADLIAHEDEYLAVRGDIEITVVRNIVIDMLHNNEVSSETEMAYVDEDGISKAARRADVVFGGRELTNAYRKRCFTKEGLDPIETSLRLAAACRTDAIVRSLEAWARGIREEFFDEHAMDRDSLHEEDKHRYDELERETGGRRVVHLAWPTSQPASLQWRKYPKHILQDKDGLCPLDLNEAEQYVIERELARERTVAFYRNPSNNSPQVFSIPYVMPSGRMSLRPDFIFFVRDENGEICPSIVDPHGTHLSDTVPKLRGYIDYVREFPGIFKQVVSVGALPSGEYRSLNLLRLDVQDAILSFDGATSEELYLDKAISNRYGEQK